MPTKPPTSTIQTYAVPFDSPSLSLVASVCDRYGGTIVKVTSPVSDDWHPADWYHVTVQGGSVVHAEMLADYVWIGPRRAKVRDLMIGDVFVVGHVYHKVMARDLHKRQPGEDPNTNRVRRVVTQIWTEQHGWMSHNSIAWGSLMEALEGRLNHELDAEVDVLTPEMVRAAGL